MVCLRLQVVTKGKAYADGVLVGPAPPKDAWNVLTVTSDCDGTCTASYAYTAVRTSSEPRLTTCLLKQ